MKKRIARSLLAAASLLSCAWSLAQDGGGAAPAPPAAAPVLQEGAAGPAAVPVAPPAVPKGVVEVPGWLQDPERIERGKNRFNSNCAAYCHGFEGGGGKTPAFRGRTDLDPVAAFKTITAGRVGSDVMPAWGNGFSDEKRWELVAYIMYLTRQPPK